MSSIKRLVSGFDAHVGFEFAHVGGRMIKRPVHSPRGLKAFLRFCEDFQPQVVLLGGDNGHYGVISRHHKGKPRLVEGLRVKDELALQDELLISPLEDIASVERKIYHLGNHERWFYDFLEENPGLEEMVEPHKYLDLEKRGWEIYDIGEISKVGKLYFVHGDAVFPRAAPEHAAKKLVNVYRRNIRCGHLHTYQVHTPHIPNDRYLKDMHTGICLPALCNRAADYSHNAPSRVVQGFHYAWIDASGDFTEGVVVMVNDEFIFNGKRYHGK